MLSTRLQTSRASNLSRHHDQEVDIRSNRSGFTLNVPHQQPNPDDLRRKSGFLLFDSPTGRRLTYDFHVFLGDILKNKSYFYIVRSDAGGIDEVDHKGKVKLGYSSAESQTAGYAMRLGHYRQWWGESGQLHLLVVFAKEPASRAHDFETAVKEKLKHTFEHGSNIRYGQSVKMRDKQHEFFRYNMLDEVMRATREVHQRGDMRANYRRPQGINRDHVYRGGAVRAWTI